MAIIIASTDFSDIGNNAANYACRLGSDIGASIIIFHSFMVPVTFSDTPMPVMPVDERQKIAEDRMSQLLQQLKPFYPHLAISGKIIYGDVLDDLEEYTEDEIQPSLVVMGNTADSSEFLGSTTLDALRTLQFPVLAVPLDAVYRPVKNICFALDYKNINDLPPLHKLAEITKELNAELHILTIEDNTDKSGDNLKIDTGELHSVFSSLPVNYHFIDNANTDLAIQNFLETNHMDWLAVIPHKHSFFERLFHKSHTAHLAHKVHIPLMAVHETSK